MIDLEAVKAYIRAAIRDIERGKPDTYELERALNLLEGE